MVKPLSTDLWLNRTLEKGVASLGETQLMLKTLLRLRASQLRIILRKPHPLVWRKNSTERRSCRSCRGLGARHSAAHICTSSEYGCIQTAPFGFRLLPGVCSGCFLSCHVLRTRYFLLQSPPRLSCCTRDCERLSCNVNKCSKIMEDHSPN